MHGTSCDALTDTIIDALARQRHAGFAAGREAAAENIRRLKGDHPSGEWDLGYDAAIEAALRALEEPKQP
jgi:hypothetical protein